uniref:Uncharacterized protein n=1 Tax=Tanacetum cinerariifolium TaxID=118510 RepID=A0A6L2NWP6_TANCI|nr:hypothetical protein [Tanacetum cinerariifolium]
MTLSSIYHGISESLITFEIVFILIKSFALVKNDRQLGSSHSRIWPSWQCCLIYGISCTNLTMEVAVVSRDSGG